MKKYKRFFLFFFLNAFALERAIFYIYFLSAGHTPSQVSLLQVLLFSSLFLAEIPTGIIADVFGKKVSVIVGVLLKAVSLILQAMFVGSFAMLMVSFVLYAIGLSCISGSLTSLLYENARKNNELSFFARLMAGAELIDSVGLAVAMILGPFVKEYFASWSPVYFITAGANVFAALSIATVYEASNRTHEGDERRFAIKNLFANARTLFPLALPIALVHACMTPFFVNSQLLLNELKGGLSAVGASIGFTELLSGLYVFLILKHSISFTRSKLAPAIGFVAALCAANMIGNFYVTCLLLLIANIIVIYLRISLQDVLNQRITSDSVRASSLSFVTFLDTIFISIGYLFFGLLSHYFSVKICISALAIFPVISLFVLARIPSLNKESKI